MTQEEKVTDIYLVRNPKADKYVFESKEEAEADSGRTISFADRLAAQIQRYHMGGKSLKFDVLISSSQSRSYDLAEILAGKSLDREATINIAQHVHDNLEYSGVTIDKEHYPVLVINDINNAIDQLEEFINNSLPIGAKILIILDVECLRSLAHKLMPDENLELNPDYGEGIKITLGKSRTMVKISHKIKI